MKQFVTLLIILLLLATPAMAQDNPVVIASGEWAPWVGEKLPHRGFVNHITQLAFDRQGYAVKFEFYPWTRAYHSVAHGEVAVSTYWYKYKIRTRQITYSDPVCTEKMVLYHLRGKPIRPWKEIIELRDYRIGTSSGITYPFEVYDLGRRGILQLYPSKTTEENFEKLIRSRIDIFPSAEIMSQQVLEEKFSEEERAVITHDPNAIYSMDGHLIFSKKHPAAPQYIKAFNEGLKELHEDGTYDRLYKDLQEGKYNKP